VFEDQKPRRKREKPDSRARVAALESKLEDLIAQVSQNNNTSQKTNERDAQDESVSTSPSNSHSDSKPAKNTPNFLDRTNHPPTPESQTRDVDHIASITGHSVETPSSDRRDQMYPSAFARHLSNGATPETLISQGLLTICDVEICLEQFREMSVYFPFVTIPRDATAYTMLKDRPLLLHSALAVSTSANVHLQKVLEKNFKELMLRKLMLEAEKTIDLLQSILVCLGWGHFFHVPKRDQSYQLLQMAIGLCVDLGLNLTPSFAMQKKIGLHIDHYQPQGDVDEDRFWSREARRAFLGCYLVSTVHSWIWAKPNTLEYSDYILQCAKSISEEPEYPADELILPLIQIQQIGDEYHKVLRVARNENHSQSVLDRIGVQVRSFKKQMQDLKDNLRPTAAHSKAVHLAMQFASVHTFEQDLLSPFTSISRLMATGGPTDQMSCAIDSPSRIDILLDCLASATAYLDLWLTIPISTYPFLATSQWSGFIYSTVIIYRLSIGTPRVPLWDVQVARETVKLERYLEVMCEKMQEATRERLKEIVGTHNRDLYSVMGLVLQNVRNTYSRLRMLPQSLSSMDEDPVHATSFPDDESSLPVPRPGPIFETDQPRAGYQSRCPALQFWSTPVSSDAATDESMGRKADDPFLGVNMLDEDGFWSQAFADMAAVGQGQWDWN
jgi:hypothetical protein